MVDPLACTVRGKSYGAHMAEHLLPGFDTGNSSPDGATILPPAFLSVNWAASPAGPVADWPPELRAAVARVMRSASPMAVLVGREGIVVCNEAAREMFGDAHADAQGRPVADVLPIAAAFYRDAIDACRAGRSLRFRDEPIRLCRAGVCRICWFNLSLIPVVSSQGGVCAVLLMASETTEHMRMRKALAMSHQRIEMALEAGGIVGTWDFDVDSRRIIIDGSLAQQYGVPEAEARSGLSLETLSANLYADDRARVLSAVDEAVATGIDYRSRFRTITHDGALRWYVASGRPIRDERQRVVQLAGIILDVTAQAETAAALEQSNLRFDTLSEAIPQMVWSADAAGAHDYFNRRWTEFTGVPHEDITPGIWLELVHPDDRERVTATWTACLATGETYDIDYRFRRHDGVFRWLRVIAMPMRDARGRIVRWYGTSTDIEDAKQLDAQKELVTRELDHRIKNLFALVGGLVGLSVREEPDLAPLAGRLRARLEALHRAHGLIRGSGGGKAGSLRGLLEQLLDPYRTGAAGHIVIEGEDATLQASAITSVALILHELATNAAKYGALAQADGRLNVALRRSGEWQTIGWTERFAAPGTAAVPSGGFGSKLLETIVERQFRGRFVRTMEAQGLSVAIDLPSSILLAPREDG